MKRAIWLLVAATLVLTACGTEEGAGGRQSTADPDSPLLQVRSEGGFAPVEYMLGRGPTYTLLAGGSLIHTGPEVAVFPGSLVPNYLVTEIDDDQMDTVLALIDEIGLPEIDGEVVDDTQTAFVADATTEVATYWDPEGGEHSYGVYALGLEPSDNPVNQAMSELLVVLDEFASQGDSMAYEGTRVRVVAGVGFDNPDYDDVRDWPLDNTDFSDWLTYPNGWMCDTFGAEVLTDFTDATTVTQWLHPDQMMDAPTFTLTVRPLHPGEPDCHPPT
ncbi:MAG: hypothetical protein WBM90_06315 [Acidimicrobiia bacterium]